MKYLRFISILSVTVILLLCGCTKNTGTAIAVTPELDKAVSDAILEGNKMKIKSTTGETFSAAS